MNLSSASNDAEKVWDHPWTTDEMRKCQSNWSLASDVGLLRHLQQFSENLTTTVKTTQSNIDSLSNQLNEATILIENVTNASLALANTQFIESRVHEEDVDSSQCSNNSQKTDANNLESTGIRSEAEMIAIISENIQKGLAIMDERYERLEVISSDSEDENEMPQPSFILKPKDPYQNRPLPYVIGTDKWKSSTKIGLESSSSESELNDDDDDDDEDDKEMDELSQHIFIENSRRISILRRASFSSNESNDFNESNKSITNKQYSGPKSHVDKKLHTKGQDTLSSTSELTTPTTGVIKSNENIIRDTPSFAEELAKRLGSVMPTNKIIVEKVDTNQSSINRNLNDDFHDNYEDRSVNESDIFNVKSEDLFSGGQGLFDDDGEVSNSLWKDKPIKQPLKNIIPATIDVPPPMHSEETTHHSTMSDLFGDGDSDDSDDLFAPKNRSKTTIPVESTCTVDDRTKVSRPTLDITDKKLLNVNQQKSIDEITTSISETKNNNITNLFDDDDDDDENDVDLFGTSQKAASNKPLKQEFRNPQRDRPPGIIISQSDLLSSSLGSRIFQRIRQDSTDSSLNENEKQSEETSKRDDNFTQSHENTNDLSTVPSVKEADSHIHIETSDSSGISIHPQSTNSTLSSGSVNDWKSQTESTRLSSDEFHRNRQTTDSLLNTKIRQQRNNNSVFDPISNIPPSPSTRIRESNNIYEENIFDNDNNDDADDLFSPPPLPKNKSKSSSKVISLFDDSDSGDDLFSNTSSGSRSQKSASISTQQPSVEKSKSEQKRSGLFDEDIDIFANTYTSSDIGISTSGSSSKDENSLLKKSQSSVDTSKITSGNLGDTSKKLLTDLPKSANNKIASIFDDIDGDDEDLFSSIIHSKFMVNKSNVENKGSATSTMSSVDRNEVVTVPKKDSTLEAAVVGDEESKVKSENYKRDSNQTLVTNKISNSPIASILSRNKLFDDSDDDDDDNLFSQKPIVPPQIKPNQNQNQAAIINKSLNDESDSVKSQKSSMESLDKSNEFTKTQSNNDEKKESVVITDDTNISKVSEIAENLSNEIRPTQVPPNSLQINLPTSGSNDNSIQPPRRAVSGKIKNLMGKMGDLKILSPTDTSLPWRKNSETSIISDDESNDTPDRDSEDGSSISVPSSKSPPILPKKRIIIKGTPRSPPIESETAVSFDVPAQIDTLTVTSKSRVRIPVKRRPQSRHARQSALRVSGIDFDTVDTVSESFSDIDSTEKSSISKIEQSIKSNNRNDGDVDSSSTRPIKSTLNLISDDRSDISLEKESSVSITKNTLLSPSTDEEDLFDVPPDLPEDPQREDTLFGRAPILSPVQKQHQDSAKNHSSNELINTPQNKKNESENKENIEAIEESEKKVKKVIDPLRDDNHDPLEDPSSLFALVTKTPSPERIQNSLFNEDASLFSRTEKKVSSDIESKKKSLFDVFADDSTNDLFSGPFTKTTVKKSMKGVKNNLFSDLDSDGDDITDDLFGSASSKRSNQNKSEQSDVETNKVNNASDISSKPIDPFDDIDDGDDDDEDLFFDASEKLSSEVGKDDKLSFPATKAAKAKLESILDDQSDDKNDIFSIKKTIGETSASDLFSNNSNDEEARNIFSKNLLSSSNEPKESTEHRPPMKRVVTRDLRKTAEKIVEDPLSMLHDD